MQISICTLTNTYLIPTTNCIFFVEDALMNKYEPLADFEGNLIDKMEFHNATLMEERSTSKFQHLIEFDILTS